MAATKLKLATQTCKECGGKGSLPADDVGQILKGERERVGVEQKELAEYMGISATYLYDLERGNRRWTNEYLAAYLKGLEELRDGK